jgi:glycosyltransferase involved in cell wall biosynthesis
MRVCFDHQVFSLQDVGGASRYFIELANFFGRDAGIDLSLFLGFTRNLLEIQRSRENHIRLFRAPARIGPGLFRYALNELISNILTPCSGKFDIYHSTYYRAMPFVRSRRLVATHHDCVQETHPEMFADVEKIRSAKRALYRSADAIICVSEASKRDLCKFYDIDTKKLHVVHHGLSRMIASDSAIHQLAKSVDRPYLLYVGSRAAYKNFKALLVAYERSGLHKDFDLLVIGGGKPTAEESQLVNSLRVGDTVHFYGLAVDDLLAAAYSRAHLFVYPSLYEGFGFPPLEAMSLGCPTLVANSSCLPEICGGGAFYFEPGNEESFACSLTTACMDESNRRGIISVGKEISSGYQWETCGRKTLQVYRHALGM